jgi:hypothetical protein
MKARETDERDVRPRLLLHLLADRLLRAAVAAGRDASEHPLQHRARQRIPVGEMLVRREPHLGAAVSTANARPVDRDAAAAERHLARLVPVPDRGALRGVLALRPDDLDDFFLE